MSRYRKDFIDALVMLDHDFVEGMGKGIAVIENGDCTGYEDAKRIRALTGMLMPILALLLIRTSSHRRAFSHDCYCR